jgi:hypothetical protein
MMMLLYTFKAFEEEENFRLVGGGERPTFGMYLFCFLFQEENILF